MVLAWGVLVPLGVLAARFYKVTPKQRWAQQLDNPAWRHTHRAAQYSGVVLMSVGAALAWSQGQGLTAAARMHAWLGWGGGAGRVVAGARRLAARVEGRAD